MSRCMAKVEAEIGHCYAHNKPTIGFGGNCGHDTIVRGFLRRVVQDKDALVRTLSELFK